MTDRHASSRRRALAQLSTGSLATLAPWAMHTSLAQARPITIGVIYVGPRDDFGYNQVATSFRSFDPHMLVVAPKVPDVRFSHCGGLWTDKNPKNTGSYFGYVEECQFLNGVQGGGARDPRRDPAGRLRGA